MSATVSLPVPSFRSATWSSGYTALRMAFGIVLLADVADLYARRALFLATAMWPWFPLGAFSLVWMTAVVGLIIGFRIRIAALLNWICCALALGLVAPNDGFQQAACDSVTIGLSFDTYGTEDQLDLRSLVSGGIPQFHLRRLRRA
jgi:hypothetical protein